MASGNWTLENEICKLKLENKEQIEVSKFYEKLPKPHAIAVQEWLESKIYHRNTKDEELEN